MATTTQNPQGRDAETNARYGIVIVSTPEIEKLRSSILGLSRRRYQVWLKRGGTARLCGAEHPATVKLTEQLVTMARKLDAQTARLHALVAAETAAA